MAKISYANLKLKVNTNVKTFNFNGNEIEVLQYLPVEDKYDLIMITLQKAYEGGIYNPCKLDMYFCLYLVYMYSNLSFTEKQKEDEAKIYDCLKSNGFIEQLIDNIPKEEYEELFTHIQETLAEKVDYSKSFSSILQKFIDDLPKNAEAAANIVENFDKEKYSEVVEFAKAANAGRPIV